MKKFLKVCIAFLLLAGVSGLAQEKAIEDGNEEFNEFAFIDAREAYLKVAEEGYRDENMLKKLGDSYYFTADYTNAAKWYGALYDISDPMDPEYLYRYGLSLKSTQQYDASDNVMEEFYASKGQDYRARLFANERNYLTEIEQQSGRFELINIGFNSELSDFAPAFNQGNLVFASNRKKGNMSRRVHDWNEEPFLDLFMVNTGNEQTSNVDHFSNDINTKYHESTAVFSKDGNTMYFTRNNYTDKDYKTGSNGINHLKLYRAKKNGDDWEVEELPFNSDEYSVAHPALSKDGKTLYFASDMPGGKGQSDLYKVTISGDGFGNPVSLGDGINTEGRETFPFVSSKDKLYFASDGHVGLGGLDVFVADMTTNGFGDVYNVGRPINSPQDDFTFVINGTTGIGYFASNREGGVGNDDIYSFNRVKDLITGCTQTLNGTVLDQNTNEAIGGAKVVLLNADGDMEAETMSALDGSFTFPLNCSSQYSIRAIKDNYETAEKAFATSNILSADIKKTLYMKGGRDLGVTPAGIGSDLVGILGLSPIYFDYDKDNIRYDAEIELRKVVAVMKTYPSMKIDVRSHTDSRADDAYNMDLSERRAQSTIEWLVTQGGIERSRLSGKGYGETQLTNGCVNGAKCSEGAHQMNRRSEFIIMQ
ncbi:OmpA family protein [Marinirhabdus gelatinilytica]|uniref:WD40 repeat protein n=1 Tax=Marinirhabdus gelatinilytica TaxID=1703343 RepID=A0A370Q686_9FLAO|nr:OmpA family protein [Marinirhabdus gelatinilytica]RDK83871.1 WD40 repeat protein [Marinirhabdus gelatinilytica]